MSPGMISRTTCCWSMDHSMAVSRSASRRSLRRLWSPLTMVFLLRPAGEPCSIQLALSIVANVKVTTAISDESANNPFADSGNQYGDYEGIVAFDGSIHPIWTDGRFDATIDPATGLTVGEEIFTATISA